MQIEELPREAIYIPGLLVTPTCGNYAVLRNEFAKHGIRLDFLDLTAAYSQPNFSYKSLVQQTAAYTQCYKTAVTYSLGSNILMDAIYLSGHKQPENVIFLSPIGNPENSSFGAKAQDWKREGYRKSRPTDDFPDGFPLPYSFYEEKLDLYRQNTVCLTGNSLAIIGKHDHLVSYDIVEDMEKIGVKKVSLIDDTHNLMKIRRVLPEYVNQNLPIPLWS